MGLQIGDDKSGFRLVKVFEVRMGWMNEAAQPAFLTRLSLFVPSISSNLAIKDAVVHKYFSFEDMPAHVFLDLDRKHAW